MCCCAAVLLWRGIWQIIRMIWEIRSRESKPYTVLFCFEIGRKFVLFLPALLAIMSEQCNTNDWWIRAGSQGCRHLRQRDCVSQTDAACLISNPAKCWSTLDQLGRERARVQTNVIDRVQVPSTQPERIMELEETQWIHVLSLLWTPNVFYQSPAFYETLQRKFHSAFSSLFACALLMEYKYYLKNCVQLVHSFET